MRCRRRPPERPSRFFPFGFAQGFGSSPAAYAQNDNCRRSLFFQVILSAAKDLDGRSDDRRQQRTSSMPRKFRGELFILIATNSAWYSYPCGPLSEHPHSRPRPKAHVPDHWAKINLTERSYR